MTDSFQPLPALSVDQFNALRADIAANGVLVPVVKDQHGRIIDGNHRAAIATELGIDYPVQVVEIIDDDEALDRAVVLNCSRRHLTRGQVRSVIANEIRRCPGDSDRAISRRVACSPSTVGTVRAQVSKLDSLQDDLEKCARDMMVDTCFRMLPVLFQPGVSTAEVRAAWKTGMDGLEDSKFPAAAVWLRERVWKPLDDYLRDEWHQDIQRLTQWPEAPLSASELVRHLDALRHYLPMMTVVLREVWPEIFTDAADEWLLKGLAAGRFAHVSPRLAQRSLDRVSKIGSELHKLWCAILGLNQ